MGYTSGLVALVLPLTFFILTALCLGICTFLVALCARAVAPEAVGAIARLANVSLRNLTISGLSCVRFKLEETPDGHGCWIGWRRRQRHERGQRAGRCQRSWPCRRAFDLSLMQTRRAPVLSA